MLGGMVKHSKIVALAATGVSFFVGTLGALVIDQYEASFRFSRLGLARVFLFETLT